MFTRTGTSVHLEEAAALAREIAAVGGAINLPYIAVSCDIGAPTPPVGPDGRPFAETTFRWIDDFRYWEDRSFALRSAFIHACRVCSEPFYYTGGRMWSWRANPALEAVSAEGIIATYGVGAAVVAPAYLTGGVIGAVVWATTDASLDVAALFEARAAELHALALRFVATYAEATGATSGDAPAHLTRREIQCLKWAAAGKTDAEIGKIVSISTPTVRFHIVNASRKLGVAGRSQAIHRAATLGYIGSADQTPTRS